MVVVVVVVGVIVAPLCSPPQEAGERTWETMDGPPGVVLSPVQAELMATGGCPRTVQISLSAGLDLHASESRVVGP